MQQKIIILDFGSQTTQLIARRLLLHLTPQEPPPSTERVPSAYAARRSGR